MPRREHRRTPVVISGRLYTDDDHNGIRLDEPAWWAWLLLGFTFYSDSPHWAASPLTLSGASAVAVTGSLIVVAREHSSVFISARPSLSPDRVSMRLP